MAEIIAKLLASSIVRYALVVAIALSLGYGTQTYRWHVSNIAQAAKEAEELVATKEKYEAIEQLSDAQNAFADSRRDSVRIEYRDRMRNIYSTVPANTCPEKHGADAGSTAGDAQTDGRDRVANIAAEARAGLQNQLERVNNAIAAEKAALRH
jgi:hypothetical protein